MPDGAPIGAAYGMKGGGGGWNEGRIGPPRCSNGMSSNDGGG